MATRTYTELIDDLDGQPLEDGGSTISFALEGRAYEIDVSSANAQKLRDALAPFIAAGRRSGATSATRTPSVRRRGSSETSAMRVWAVENGYTVSDRGRLSAPVVAAYEAAHGR
jgi:hypothetical protein